MIAFIYEWMENLAFYLVILVAVMQMIPNKTYQKYIRFFAGLILILMLSTPLLRIFGMLEVQSSAYQEAMREIKEGTQHIEEWIGEEVVVGGS